MDDWGFAAQFLFFVLVQRFLAERLSQLGDRISQMQDLGVQLRHQGIELVDGVEHFNALGVWVEAYLERPGHGRDPAAELLLGILEALGDVVDWLIFLVLVGLDGGAGRLECAVLWLVTDGVQQFSVSRQQTGTVSLDFVVFLAQTELYGEPVDLKT